MKKILSLIIVAIMLMTMTVPAVSAAAVPSAAAPTAASTGTPTLYMTNSSAKAGQTLEMNVCIKDNPGIFAINIKLDFPKDVLELVDVTDGLMKVTGKNTNEASSNYGTVLAESETTGVDVTGNGALFTVKFKVKDGATAQECTVGLNVISANNTALAYVTPATESGTAKVTEAPDVDNVLVDGGKSFNVGRLYYKNGDESYAFTGSASDYNAHYDPETNILTLKDYNGGSISIGGVNKADITIELIGTNTVTGSIVNGVGGDITIIGTGSLRIDATYSGNAYGIEAGFGGSFDTGNVTIKDNADVTINSLNNADTGNAYGIYAKQSITISESASVNITCQAPNRTSRGATCYGLFVPPATSGGRVTIDTDGTITIVAKDAGADAYSYGVNAPNYTLTKVGNMTVEWKKTTVGGYSFYYGVSFSSATHAINIDETNCYASYRYGTPYTVTVTNGSFTGTGVKYETDIGKFLAGDEITLTAPARYADSEKTLEIPFGKWTSDDVTVANPTTQSGATFTMPGKNVAVTAQYNPFIVKPSFTRDASYSTKGSVSFTLVSNGFSSGYLNILPKNDLEAGDCASDTQNTSGTSYECMVFKNYCPAGEYVVAVSYNGTTYYSEPFTVDYSEAPVEEPISTGNATITAPVGGKTPNFTATTDEPGKYTAEVVWWVDVSKDMQISPIDLTDPSNQYYKYTFVGGQQYRAVVKFTAVGENKLSTSNTFTINGYETNWTINGLYRTYTFTATGTGGGAYTPTYSATVDDIDLGTAKVGYYYNDFAKKIIIRNTGTESLYPDGASLALIGADADKFYLKTNSVPAYINAGEVCDSNWYITPKDGLEVGTYTATIQFKDIYGKVTATGTVTFTVGDHEFDTTKWESDETTHWNPCKDAGCTVRGNQAAHDSNVTKGTVAATFDTDGYTGDKYCSVCDRKTETGKAIPAGKYILESKATMTPAAITADMCANDLVFASLESGKYTVSLYTVYDLTDSSQNTDSGSYPKDKKFIEGHQYRIVFQFNAVGSYVYDEMNAGYTSKFTLNGVETDMAPFTALSGSTSRKIELTAGASAVVHPAKPTISVSGSYTYTGSEITATVTGFDSETMTITGNVGKDAGEYTVSVASKTGAWADGTTDAVTVKWTIAKADPAVTLPTGLTGTKGNALSTVALPSGWAWKAPEMVMNATGDQSFAAVYTPADTTNYNTKEANITVAVSEPAPVIIPVDAPTAITGLIYNGSAQQGVADGTGYTLAGHKQTKAGTYTATATLTSGYKWSDGTTDPKTITWTIARKKVTPVIEVSGTYKYTGSAINPTYTVKVDDDILSADEYTASVTENINAGNGKITVSDKANGNYEIITAEKTFVIGKGTQAKPSGITGVAPKGTDTSDGKITGVTTAMEYRKEGATEWTKVTGTEITGLSAGSYEVRFAETENLSASEAAAVTVAEHTHSFGTEWKKDGTKHWHECACGAKGDEAAHTGGTATCKEKAACSVCGEKYGDFAAHSYETVWSSDEAKHWHKCSVCGDKKDEAAHVYDNDCDTDCNVCGKTRTITHRPVFVKKVEAECEKAGNTEHYRCSCCGKLFSDAAATKEITDPAKLVIPATGHIRGDEWKSSEIYHWHECKVCGERMDTAFHRSSGEATETNPQVCDVCGYVIKEASGHTHSFTQKNTDEKYLKSAATCKASAVYYYSCECGARGTETFEYGDKLTHSFKTEWSSDGSKHWHECSLCKDKKDEADHSFEWKTDKEAAVGVAGSKHEECTVCGYKKEAVTIDPIAPATTTTTTSPAQTTTGGTSEAPEKSGNAWVWIVVAVVVLGGAAVTIYFVTKKKKQV